MKIKYKHSVHGETYFGDIIADCFKGIMPKVLGKKTDPSGCEEVEVRMSLNGIEVNPKYVIMSIRKNAFNAVMTEISCRVDNNRQELNGRVNTLANELEEIVKDVAREIFDGLVSED